LTTPAGTRTTTRVDDDGEEERADATVGEASARVGERDAVAGRVAIEGCQGKRGVAVDARADVG
jgi:hypothetical protein